MTIPTERPILNWRDALTAVKDAIGDTEVIVDLDGSAQEVTVTEIIDLILADREAGR